MDLICTIIPPRTYQIMSTFFYNISLFTCSLNTMSTKKNQHAYPPSKNPSCCCIHLFLPNPTYIHNLRWPGSPKAGSIITTHTASDSILPNHRFDAITIGGRTLLASSISMKLRCPCCLPSYTFLFHTSLSLALSLFSTRERERERICRAPAPSIDFLCFIVVVITKQPACPAGLGSLWRNRTRCRPVCYYLLAPHLAIACVFGGNMMLFLFDHIV